MVTSSAVVGSSAIRIAGRQINAMAIMARWRRPPEKLEREEAHRLLGCGKSDPAQHLDGPSSRRCGVDAMMKHQRLADLVANRVQGRQRAHRLLEDDRDPPAANVAALRCSAQTRRDRGPHPGRLGSLNQIEPPVIRALAGKIPRTACEITVPSRFRRQPPRCGWAEVERHAGHGLDLALVGGKSDAQIADRQQRLDHRPSPNSAPAAASVARG